jgi:hypothetical protein
MADGTKYDGHAGYADISEGHARAIDQSWYKSAGVMRGGVQFSFGTKKGRACRPCKRTWNAWNAVCPRCGQATVRSE